jgi:cyclophilin family peptidyl-prolyl cis-trans isomerase
VPTAKQRRQAAQRHLQRQMERRAELARKRRRTMGIVATVVAVAVVVGAVLLINNLGGDSSSSAADSSSSASSSAAAAPAAAKTNADGTVSCDYVADTSGNPNLKDVGTPPNPDKTPGKGTSTLLMSTNQGNLTLTLDRAKAPCAAASFAYLASKKFFDGSTCHREVNQPTSGVLQCGDPTGTGSGGPSYTFAEEIPAGTTYPRGTIAMANSGGGGTTSSQFFLCFTDAELPAQYTPVGTVDAAGLAVLDKIAKAGNDGSFEPNPGGGKPKIPVDITSITVAG